MYVTKPLVAYNLHAVRAYWKAQFTQEWIMDSHDSRWMQILSAWRWGKVVSLDFSTGSILCDFSRPDRFRLENLSKRAAIWSKANRLARKAVESGNGIEGESPEDALKRVSQGLISFFTAVGR